MPIGETLKLVIAESYGSVMLVPLAFCIVLRLALRNSIFFDKEVLISAGTTLVISTLNIFLMALFANEIAEAMTEAYMALKIPMLPENFWSETPMILKFVISLLTLDFVGYWSHRLMHTKWMWPTHAAHHTDTVVNPFSLYRIHILEALVMHGTGIVILTWLQLPETLPFTIAIIMAHGIYVHTNLPIRHGPFRFFIASPAFHFWHHADTPEAYGKNLANMFPFYDIVFGTYYDATIEEMSLPMGAKASGLSDRNPVEIYLYPFEEWSRLLREAYHQALNKFDTLIRRYKS